VLAGIAAAASAAAGCTGRNDDTGPAKVTLLTSYGARGRDAYLYVAQEKGYLRAAGFDASIEAGAELTANLKRIAGGGVFAPVDLTGCLLAAGRGAGLTGAGLTGVGPAGAGLTGVTFVAGIHQRTTAAILAPGGGRIDTPGDLAGKTLAHLPGSSVRDIFPTYARLAGIDAGRVRWVEATPQGLPGELSGGSIAGVGESVVDRRVVESVSHGRPTVVLAYSDQLQDLYGDALATSAAYAQANPDRVRKFAAALLHGLADAIDYPAAAGAIMHKYVPVVTGEDAADEITLLAPYVRSAAAGLPVGALDANRVARNIAVLQGTGQIAPGLTPDQFLNPALTPSV
jgi:NitT/TauT family transport system substrate-binding protein